MLGRAIGEFGRIFKTQHNLLFIIDPAYRRKTLTQLNPGESRHSLARALMYGKKGTLYQNYREGKEDQLGAALDTIQENDVDIDKEDIQKLSPVGHEHINIVGRYSFHLLVLVEIENGFLRPLIQIKEK